MAESLLVDYCKCPKAVKLKHLLLVFQTRTNTEKKLLIQFDSGLVFFSDTFNNRLNEWFTLSDRPNFIG